MFLLALLSIPIAYISHKIVETFYPGKVKQILIKNGWKLIEFCSYVEIKAVAIYTTFRSYCPFLSKEQMATITYINSEQEMVYKIDHFLRLKERNMLSDIEYDFILYELPIKGHNKFTKCMLRYAHHDQIEKIEYSSYSNFNLNAIQFNFKESPDEIININFQDKQFFVHGNILFDRKFLKWYMYKYHSVSIYDDDCYSVTFIDHKMNCVSFNEEQHILVMKHNYEIVSKTI